MTKRKLSALAIIVVGVVCIWNSLNSTRWNSSGVIVWDAACYYGYLTKTFNHKADTLTPDEIRMPGLAPANKYVLAPNGNKVFKTTMGMAVLYSPFYATGYIIHSIQYGYAGTGVEKPYRMAMQFVGTFYLLLALIFMRRILLRYFTGEITALTLLLVVFGTNTFYYTTYEPCMTHVPNMAMFLGFLWLAGKWHTRPSLGLSVLIGLLAGLMTLVRPTNALIGIFFLGMGISSIAGMKDRMLFLLSQWKHLLLMFAMAILVWAPQMIYWYKVTGHIYFYSYVGEYFYFTHPNLYNGLLGWRKGWLVYTPLGALMLTGFAFMHRYMKEYVLPSLFFYLTFTWVIFSWWCWWYGGSFGSRPMVEAYAILAFPLASLLQYVFVHNRLVIVKAALGLLLVLLVSLNLFQTWQAKKGFLHYQDMTYDAYREIFLKAKPAPESMLQEPDWTSAARGWPTK